MPNGHTENSVQSHKRFQEKAGLQFPLLSDNKKEVAHKFHNLKVKGTKRDFNVTGVAHVSHDAFLSANAPLKLQIQHNHMRTRRAGTWRAPR